MKITKQITSQVEVEVSLPTFTKRENKLLNKVTYNAYYGEKHSDNFQFAIENGQACYFNNWCFFHDFNEEEQITFDEFSDAFTRFNELWHLLYSQVSDKAKQGNGEYYQELEEQLKHECQGSEFDIPKD